MQYDGILLFTALIIAINSSLLGSYLVLNKMSMLIDAIAHAVLPGIVISYLFLSEEASFLTLITASMLAILCVVFIEWLGKAKTLKKDAGIGIVYTFLFALGLVILSFNEDNSSIDLESVLFGDLLYIPFKSGVEFFGVHVPWESFYLLVLTLIIVTVFVRFKKMWLLISFDRALAKSMGLNIFLVNIAMLSLTSISTVFSFQSVGAIMVISLSIVPSAIAQLFCKNYMHFLKTTLIVSTLFVFFGFYIAKILNLNVIGSIAFLLGICFFTVLIAQLLSNKKRLNGK